MLMLSMLIFFKLEIVLYLNLVKPRNQARYPDRHHTPRQCQFYRPYLYVRPWEILYITV